MYTSIEKLMLCEFAVDTLAIWAVMYGRCRIRAGRLLMAGALGAISTGVSVVFITGGMLRTLYALACAPLLIRTATGQVGFIRLVKLSGLLMVISAALSATVNLLPRLGIPCCALICGGISLGSGFIRGCMPDSWEAAATIRTQFGSCRLTGVIDTGNRLTEPFSSLPVMVAGLSEVMGVLPPGAGCSDSDALIPGMREVAYGGLGGNGTLCCFMPDELRIEFHGQTFSAGHIWVAVYPGRLPGGHGALIPPAAIEGFRKGRNGGRYKCPATDR